MSSYMEAEKGRQRDLPTRDLLEIIGERICDHEPGYEDAYAALSVLEERAEPHTEEE